MKKIALIVCVIVLVTTVSVAFAYSGSNYTSNTDLATKLSKLLNGEVSVFSNGKKYKVDDVFPQDLKFYWDSDSGYQCYAYANAAYYYLFGDSPKHGDSSYSNSKIVSGMKGKNKLTEEMLINAGVGCGAWIRTTANSSGSYHSSDAHSIILLSYNSSNVTYLHAARKVSGGSYYIQLSTKSWKDFNTYLFSKRYICAILQPNVTAYTVNPPTYDTFMFKDVVYPKTFKINTTNGWNLGGGTLVCDKKLKTITTTIITADGKTNISGPRTYSNLNSYSYTIKSLDTMDGSNNGVRFSYIKNAGNYIWILTATDETGRTLTLSMPFTAVSGGSTATATKALTYTSEIAYGFTTPAALKAIDSETFSGITAKSIRIAGKVTQIGSKAFANCSKLVSIYIPSSCTSIASDAFSGVSELSVYGQSGSYAEIFAKQRGFAFYPVLSFSQRIRQYILASDNEKVYNPTLDLDGNGIINSLDYIQASKTE